MGPDEAAVRVTFIWFHGCSSPYRGEEGPAAMVAQYSDHKEGRGTQSSPVGHGQRVASNNCLPTLVGEASSLLGELQLRLVSFPVLRDINCAPGCGCGCPAASFSGICKLGFAGNRRRAEVQRARRTSPGPHS